MDKKLQQLQPRECELCDTVIYYHHGKRNDYILWQADAAYQTGLSRKYLGELAGFCKLHAQQGD